MVVKIQRPLFPTDGPILVYNEDMSFEEIIPQTEEWRAMFNRYGLSEYARLKFYAEVEMDGTIMRVKQPLSEDLAW